MIAASNPIERESIHTENKARIGRRLIIQAGSGYIYAQNKTPQTQFESWDVC